MKCIYYLSPTLKSTQNISDDLHSIGIDDWFLHIHNKDESGLVKQHLHSSNYLETLDLIREGLIGAGLGLMAGLCAAAITSVTCPADWVCRDYFSYYLLWSMAWGFGRCSERE